MKPGWTSKIPEITRRMEGSATRSALKAGAEVLAEKIRDDLKDGFTSGDFTTGKLSREAVKRSRPTPKRVRVQTFNPVLIEWTLGHHNLFTGQYERVDYFTANLHRHQHAIAAAFARRYKQKLTELIVKAAKR